MSVKQANCFKVGVVEITCITSTHIPLVQISDMAILSCREAWRRWSLPGQPCAQVRFHHSGRKGGWSWRAAHLQSAVKTVVSSFVTINAGLL